MAVAPAPIDPIARHALEEGNGDGDGDVGVELPPPPPQAATRSSQPPAASLQLEGRNALRKNRKLAAGRWKVAADR